jgi:transcriptional regulator with XRE-family HTH domain
MLGIGKAIKAERKRQGYTSQFVADSIGVSIRTIRNVESDNGGTKAIEKVLNFLGLKIVVKPKND